MVDGFMSVIEVVMIGFSVFSGHTPCMFSLDSLRALDVLAMVTLIEKSHFSEGNVVMENASYFVAPGTACSWKLL
jgi:hypothetical protein